jgi:hypothetical protein
VLISRQELGWSSYPDPVRRETTNPPAKFIVSISWCFVEREEREVPQLSPTNSGVKQ